MAQLLDFSSSEINSMSTETKNACYMINACDFDTCVILLLFHAYQLNYESKWKRDCRAWNMIGVFSRENVITIDILEWKTASDAKSDIFIMEICCNIGARSTKWDNDGCVQFLMLANVFVPNIRIFFSSLELNGFLF